MLSTERLGVAKNSYALKRVREFQIELEFEVLGFYGKGKTGVHREKTLGARERTNNKLNPHMVWTPGLEPSHIGGRQVLYAMRHPDKFLLFHLITPNLSQVQTLYLSCTFLLGQKPRSVP